ncbi:MAG: dihydropteroate synthase [Gemmatimonadota bacterium]|nr:dihydropteroate synthase [Gemmatimonadota bacterium]
MPESARTWRVRDHDLTLDEPLVAGVLNVTPDSFSDGGRFLAPRDAVARAHEMVEDGADLLDVGAESTRPGADPVPPDEQWSRLAPVLEGLRGLGIPISIDTRSLAVAERALGAGASAINDVSGLRDEPELARLAARTGAGLVVMHMRGTPRTMQGDVRYADLVGEVRAALERARQTALEAGCDPRQVAVDPGIGFGKSVEGNLELLGRLDEIRPPGAPVWVGPSRKSFLGRLLDAPPDRRVAGTIGACLAAVRAGADVVRVHDVRAVKDALRVERAVAREASAAPLRRAREGAAVAAGGRG